MKQSGRPFLQVMLLCVIAAAPSTARSQTPTSSSNRLTRSEVGASAVLKADTVVLDTPQDAFTPGVDKQVVVVFEWEGTPGNHRCEVAWTSPDGTVALRGQVDLNARGRKFASHFTLLIPETLSPGLWAAEVSLDGKPSGTRTFRVMKGAQGQKLAPDQLYQLGMEATLGIEAMVPPGAEPRKFSGFVLFDDAVITTFQGLEGATGARVSFQDGSAADAVGLLAFNREYDWALLRVPVPKGQRRLHVVADYKIGDRYAFIRWLEDQRVVAGGSVMGRNEVKALPRVVLSDGPSRRSLGSPLMNDRGDVFGLIGVAADTLASPFDSTDGRDLPWIGSAISLALPLAGFSDPVADPQPFAQLRASSRKPVTRGEFVSYAFLAKGLATPSGVGAQGQGSEFTGGDGALTAIVTWKPTAPLSSALNHVVYDRANRMVLAGRPIKAVFKAGQRLDSSSPVPFTDLPAGDYRLDIELGEEVAWRTYFRLKK